MRRLTLLIGVFALTGLIMACGESSFSDSNSPKKRRGAGAADGRGTSGDINGADGSGVLGGNGQGADDGQGNGSSHDGSNGNGNGNGTGANGGDGSGASSPADDIFGGGVGGSGSGGSNNNDGSGAGGSGNNTGNGSGNNGGGAGNNTGGSGSGSNNTGSNNGGASNNIPNNPLPTDCQPQKMLILDFKSGWWSGDGGTTFSNLIKGELTTFCPKGESSVEYHHILKTNTPAKFYNNAAFDYTQVWILSGSTADNLDIDPNHPGLADVIAQINAKKTKLFLGAGFGSIDHSNKVATGVLGVTPFATAHKTGDILNIKQNGSNVSIINRTTPIATGNIFTNVTGSIPDAIKASSTSAYSDELLMVSGLTVLSKCTLKGGSQANCVGVARINDINVVFDSGLQRFYAAYLSGEEGVKQYLRNIARALAI